MTGAQLGAAAAHSAACVVPDRAVGLEARWWWAVGLGTMGNPDDPDNAGLMVKRKNDPVVAAPR